MKLEMAILVCMLILQWTILEAHPLKAASLSSSKIARCRHPLRFINMGTERLPCEEPGFLPECARCSSSRQCIQSKCWGGKCTDGSDASLRRCFKAECASCRSSLECSTKKCWQGKCVYNNDASKKKCFPPKPECHSCISASECQQSKCWGNRCTDGSDRSLRRCFYPECHSCTRATQCSTKKCWGGKCVYNTTASKRKCFPTYPDPDPCLRRQLVTDPKEVIRLRRVCP